MIFLQIITVFGGMLSVIGIPLAAYYISKKISLTFVSHKFFQWIASITTFIFSVLFLSALLGALMEFFLVALGRSHTAVALIVNVILLPLTSFSTLVGFGFLVHTLLRTTPKETASGTGPKRHSAISVLVVIGIVLAPYLLWQGVLYLSSHNKKFAESIVSLNLKEYCPPNNSSNCEELRPLPAILKNKKIVMATSTYVEFSPYEVKYRQMSDIDVDGYINLSTYKSPGNHIVSPAEEKTGYLQDRYYSIVRAVYSYRCSYCFDSDDFGYLVLEDSSGYRFMAFFDDFATSTRSDIPWDEQVPFQGLNVEWFLEAAN